LEYLALELKENQNEFPLRVLKVSHGHNIVLLNWVKQLCDVITLTVKHSLVFFPDLKGLSIRACPSVTPHGLLSALALAFLQHFDYFSKSPVGKSFVRGIAAQNPSLETISVRLYTTGGSDERTNPLDIDNRAWSSEEKTDFFRKHRRIRALHNLVLTISILSFHSLGYKL